MSDPITKFAAEIDTNIKAIRQDQELQALASQLMQKMTDRKYSYNFSWLGRPIIQMPQDILAMQEIIWSTKPDLIIETGVAHGGSLIFYASMLELLGNEGEVVGVEIDLREHNRRAIEEHPLYKRIKLVDGSSTAPDTVAKVKQLADAHRQILVCLDSNHTHEHVLRELELYSPFVTKGSYLVVFDTIVEDMDDKTYPDRPWGKNNNPKTAVYEFLRKDDRFEIDEQLDSKLVLSVAPSGYLKRVR